MGPVTRENLIECKDLARRHSIKFEAEQFVEDGGEQQNVEYRAAEQRELHNLEF